MMHLIVSDELEMRYTWIGPVLVMVIPKSPSPRYTDEEYFWTVWNMFRGKMRTLNEFIVECRWFWPYASELPQVHEISIKERL